MGSSRSHRVLILSQYFWPESFRINDLALGLRDRGYEVSVLTGMPNYPQGKLFPGYRLWNWDDEFQGIPIRRVPLLTRGASKSVRLLGNFGSFALSASTIGPLLVRHPVDSILLFQPSPATVFLPAVVLKRWLKAKLLAWLQDPWPETLTAAGVRAPRFAMKTINRFVSWGYSHCDSVLIQSEAYRESLLQRGVKEDQIRYMPNWAEDYYQPSSAQCVGPATTQLPEGFRIVFGGNMGASQSLETVLKAIERTADVPDLQWVFIGDGRRRAWLQAEVQNRNLCSRVHFPGLFPPEEMPRFFAQADALLVSLADKPAFKCTVPSKIQTYLACARPVLASISGEGARILKDSGAGWVAAAEDPEGLAERVRNLARTPEEVRNRCGMAGRDYYERHFSRTAQLNCLESRLLQSEEDRCAA